MSYKLFYLLTIYFSLTTLYACSNLKFQNYYGNCEGNNSDGYITLLISNADKKNISKSNAEKCAIHLLLFSGISGNEKCQTIIPYLRNETEKNNFKTIENKFFSKNGDWKSFVRSSNDLNVTNSGYKIVVSKQELLNYLANKQIIKPLNSGF